LTLLNIQDELAQRDRKHRDKYTGENKRHLEGVETITRTGEADQGVSHSLTLHQTLKQHRKMIDCNTTGVHFLH
jgi:hypothetical protein